MENSKKNTFTDREVYKAIDDLKYYYAASVSVHEELTREEVQTELNEKQHKFREMSIL